MEDLRLGTLCEISHLHNSTKSKLFVKNKYENLREDILDFLILLKISNEEFNISFDVFSS